MSVNQTSISNQIFDKRIGVEQLLKKKDLSQILNISVRTIDSLVCAGKIPYLKIGRLVRFQKNAIEKWLLERSHYGN